MDTGWSLRSAAPADLEWMVELDSGAPHPGHRDHAPWNYDREMRRHRFRSSYDPDEISVILAGTEIAGFVAIRLEDDVWWMDPLHLWPHLETLSSGDEILPLVMASRSDGRPLRIALAPGSPYVPLFTRHGFTYRADESNEVETILECRPA